MYLFRFGIWVRRLSDVIDAAVITQSMRHLLELGEVITSRPWLTAGKAPAEFGVR